MSEPLSPTAQAVLVHAQDAYWSMEAMAPNDANVIAAAAIRALVDAKLPEEPEPQVEVWDDPQDFTPWYRWANNNRLRTEFLAVADELEGDA